MKTVALVFTALGTALCVLWAMALVRALDYRWTGIVGIEFGWTDLAVHREAGGYTFSTLSIPTWPVALGVLLIAGGCGLGYFARQ
jgi:hypothetical protein